MLLCDRAHQCGFSLTLKIQRKFSSNKIKLVRYTAAKLVLSHPPFCSKALLALSKPFLMERAENKWKNLRLFTLQPKGIWWIRFKFDPSDLCGGTFHLQRELEIGLGFVAVFALILVHFSAINKVFLDYFFFWLCLCVFSSQCLIVCNIKK